MHLDENIVVADFRYGGILEDEGLERVAGALDEPLLLRGWKRHGVVMWYVVKTYSVKWFRMELESFEWRVGVVDMVEMSGEKSFDGVHPYI